MKSLLDLKCPSCAAQLSVEEGRDYAYCQYCGSKVLINDDSKNIYRHIDDADIKRAETERIVKLKEIELEEKKQDGRKILLYIFVGVVFLMIVVGIILMCVLDDNHKSPGAILIVLGFGFGILGGMFYTTSKKKDKRKSSIHQGIKITSAIVDTEGKNYETLVSILKSAGFSNISCVPMKDLNLFTARKNGQVNSLVIDGEENIRVGDVFSPDASITITYHSRK